jgi:hypothetical protein
MIMAIIGNTVVVKMSFTDGGTGVLTDPESVTFTVYDQMKRIVSAAVSIPNTYRKSVGYYEYPYVIPNGAGSITLEIVGVIEGNPMVTRTEITRVWD